MAQVLLVIAFGFAVAFFVMSSTKSSSSSKRKSRKSGKNRDFDMADIGDLADAMNRATEAMEKLHTEQNIDKLSAKYGGSSSQSAPQVKVKLDRMY